MEHSPNENTLKKLRDRMNSGTATVRVIICFRKLLRCIWQNQLLPHVQLRASMKRLL